MTDGSGIVRPGIPHALLLMSSFNGAVVVSKVMMSLFFFSLAKFLSITSHFFTLRTYNKRCPGHFLGDIIHVRDLSDCKLV